jgi:hypothetical protein
VLLSGLGGAESGEGVGSTPHQAASGSSKAHALGEAAVPVAPAAAALERNTSVGAASTVSAASTASAASAGGSKAAAAGPALWQLADLLLLPPDPSAASAMPLLYARVAVLLLTALEGAVAGAAASEPRPSPLGAIGPALHAAGAASLRSLYADWVLPRVLQPLLSPAVLAAWQQPPCVRAYWCCVLPVYAAAVQQLGLAAVRAALPDWHSAEVMLLAETGWEAEKGAAPTHAAPSAGKALQLLLMLGTHGSCQPAHRRRQATVCGTSDSSAASILAAGGAPAALLVGLGPLAASAGRAGGSHGSGLHHAVLDGILMGHAASQAAAGGAHGPGSITGRVTHLLQRIAEEKVVRRSLHTTHEFMSGVGWSLPRAATPPADAPGSSGSGGVAAMLPLRFEGGAQQRGSYEGLRPASAAASTAAGTVQRVAASEDGGAPGGGLRASSASAAVGSTSQQQPQLLPSEQPQHPHHMPRAASAPAKAAAGAGHSQAQPAGQGAPAAAACAMGSSQAAAAGERDWAGELQQLRSMLESPVRASAGKQTVWLCAHVAVQHSHGHL